MNIPVDLTNASVPIIKSSSSLTPSIQQQDSNFNNNRIYGLHGNPNENTLHSFESNNQKRPLSSYTKRSVHDIPTTNRPSTAHSSSDRTVNELRVNLSSPSSFQQQNKISLQIDEKIPPPQQQQRITRLIFF